MGADIGADMGATVFIGDEVTAAGFRLTGIETLVPQADAAGEVLREARKIAGLVIMTADLARHVPADELDAALIAETPPLAIIPDARFRAHMPDLASRLMRVLGIEE
jgi:vacuolar-type H+-ATPase subunit F/Vma7